MSSTPDAPHRRGGGDRAGHDQPGHDHPGHGHAGHSHVVTADSDSRFLAGALALLIALMIVEVIVAITAGSLALLSDAGHMLSDAAAIAVSLWAIRLAARPASGAWTFGWKRAEILSAAGNGITLLLVSVLITIESVRRLVDPPHVQGSAVLVVALLGVVVNAAAAWLLSRANRTSLNIEASFQHILTDVYAFVATIIAAVVVITTGFNRADPIASLVVVALMVRSSVTLMRASGRVLLEAAPEHVDLAGIREHLMSTDHVLDVHDLHVWTVTSNLPALSAHVVIETGCFSDGHVPSLLDELQDCLVGHFDVEHSTFQFEQASHAEHERSPHE